MGPLHYGYYTSYGAFKRDYPSVPLGKIPKLVRLGVLSFSKPLASNGVQVVLENGRWKWNYSSDLGEKTLVSMVRSLCRPVKMLDRNAEEVPNARVVVNPLPEYKQPGLS